MSRETYRHKFRVFFADHSSREVTARTAKGAKLTGEHAQRVTGAKRGPACRAVSAEDLGHVGTSDPRDCPLCGGMFADEPTEAPSEAA